MPDLTFRVEGATPLEFAAVPTVLFALRVENLAAEPVRSVMLNAQVRLAANLRRYTPEEQRRLTDVFGEPNRWATTLSSLLWTHATVVVPAFTGETVVDVPVPCTYDFEVVSAKYFNVLGDGAVPVDFLFSGTVFYAGSVGLQVARISWEKEARFQLLPSVWRQAVEYVFPNSAWLRVRKDTFDRLATFRSERALPTWEAALETLLEERAATTGVSP